MAAPSPSAKPTPAGDWPAQAADKIVEVVGTVRDRTTGTAITASRGVVYGLLAALLGVTALVLTCILLDRVLVVVASEILSLLNHNRPGRADWIADIGLGLFFAVAGAVLLKKATRAPAD